MTVENRTYIQQLNDFIKKSQQDEQLTGNHVSLYLALFSIWNYNFFRNPFRISRNKVLNISHIGSCHTYSKCMKDLVSLSYIEYFPSRVKGRFGSASILSLFPPPKPSFSLHKPKNAPSGGAHLPPSESKSAPPADANMLRITNNTNSINKERGNAPSRNGKNEKPESLNDVVAFFHLLGHPETEAAKFFNHYEANGWRQAGKIPIADWPAAARKWILNIHPTQTLKNGKRAKPGNLNINQNKSYSDPL